MARIGGLGKGLDALLPSGTSNGGGNVYISIKDVRPNPHQPRQKYQVEELQELADSIREHGILQPLIVTQDTKNGLYILIAGERRWRAAEIAGLDSVPVIFRQASDREMLELALVENVQRSDLAPLETAEAYRQLNEDFHLSHEEIAAKVGKKRVTITNTLRLLRLPEPILTALANGQITEGHARALLGLSNPAAQIAAMRTIIQKELSVRQSEELTRNLMGIASFKPKITPPDPEISDIENRLRQVLGTKVTIKHGKKGGSLTIHYYSEEELNSILSFLTREDAS